MSHTKANLLLLLASLIWGTAFISQAMGMDHIGPFTFSFARTFLGFLIVLPLALIFEKKNINKILGKKNLVIIAVSTGIVFCIGMNLQQYALLKSQIANASFLTALYVPIVAIISRFIFKSPIYWMIWIAVVLSIYGSYLLTSTQSSEVQFSDGLLFLSALFFAFHIIMIDVFMKKFNSPFCFASIQYIIVVILSLIVSLFFENPSLESLRLEWIEILYCGLLSTGIAYTIQIVAQGKANPASAAIIFSMESVFAALAGWLIMDQYLNNYKIFGCVCVFLGVVLVQVMPLYAKKQTKYNV
jgi:drug/metabolite transporter (DMT)-like permease